MSGSFAEWAQSVDCSGNMAVVRTPPGSAHLAGLAVDHQIDILAEVWDHMSAEHKSLVADIMVDHPEVSKEINQARTWSSEALERARRDQPARPTLDPLDQGIEKLQTELSNFPHKDLNSWEAVRDIAAIAGKVSAYYDGARREFMDRMRARESRGR